MDLGRVRIVSLAALVALATLAACSSGGGDPPPLPPRTDTDLGRRDDPPGVAVEIVALEGASGSGSFRSGDRIAVRFRLQKREGSPWRLDEMPFTSILVSGPTFSYQRVIAERNDLVQRSVRNEDGSWTYFFGVPIPEVYLPPYNDSPSFGRLDGELAGLPLLAGTYTVGLGFAWEYTVEGVIYRDAGEATRDFLLGGAAQLSPREVTTDANCNLCHVQLEAHGGRRRSVVMCLLCHTAGAEDPNDPSVEGGTPGVSIDARVLFHKIHNGKHLPSVLGVSTNLDGSRDYAAPRKPYRVVTGDLQVRDYSDVGYPAFPNRILPLPRDLGHQALPPEAQAKEDAMRTGDASCETCHGDPDGAGPLPPPASAAVIYDQPSIPACGSCHDDVLWDRPYVANGQPMPPQPDSSGCKFCHEPSGGPLAVLDGHRHPLGDPDWDPGLAIELAAAFESGASNGDGALDPGERLGVTFALLDRDGLPVQPSQVAELRAAVSGPAHNANLLLETRIPAAALSGPQPFTIDLPELVQLELAGFSTAALGDVFTTARAPHLDVAGAATAVLVRTATTGGSSTLASPTSAPQPFADVLDATGFARDDFVVVDDGTPREEYAQIQFVEGNRLWFSSPAAPDYPPGLRLDHPAGASVREVTLVQKAKGTDFSLDPALGEITELVEFGAGNAVLVTYTGPFVLPGTYPLPLHDSPDLGEVEGEWRGKPIVPGTYTVGLFAHRDVVVQQVGEMNVYPSASPPATLDFQVGAGSPIRPYAGISSGQNCNACHADLMFHGGTYRGFETCLLCHGTAGAEDRPRYVAANAPETRGVSITLRSMLHKIHMGELLANASTFAVVGEGPDPWPDNFEVSTFETILFPPMPGAAMHCQKCHGATNRAWTEPADLDHPTAQTTPARPWTLSCGSCHDSTPARAHMDSQTSPQGFEACAICHALGQAEEVPLVHKPRSR